MVATQRMEKVEMVDLAEIIVDLQVYPRTDIDRQHVAEMAEAVKAGAALPPVRVDRKSGRVVDGVHRVTVFRQLGFEKIAVIWMDFESEAALFLAAAAANTGHGKKLSRYDVARVIARCELYGLNEAAIQQALHMTMAGIEKLMRRKSAYQADGTLVVLKGSAHDLVGGTVTAGQIEGNERAWGPSPLYLINQVINLIEGDLLVDAESVAVKRLAYLVAIAPGYLDRLRARVA